MNNYICEDPSEDDDCEGCSHAILHSPHEGCTRDECDLGCKCVKAYGGDAYDNESYCIQLEVV